MKKSYIKYFISLLLFGSNGIVASFIDMNSYEIVFFRAFLGSLLLLLIFLAGKGKFTFLSTKNNFSVLLFPEFQWGQVGCCFTRLIQRLASVLLRSCIIVAQ